MRRVCVALFLAVAVVAGCGSSTATSGAPGASGGGGNGGGGGGGSATATVTMNGQTYHLSGGTCTDVGVLGTEVAVGDYHNGEGGSGDYLDLIVKGNVVYTVAGRAGGVPWALADGKQSGSIGADMTGTFSGTDFASGTHVEGTFACN